MAIIASVILVVAAATTIAVMPRPRPEPPPPPVAVVEAAPKPRAFTFTTKQEQRDIERDKVDHLAIEIREARRDLESIKQMIKERQEKEDQGAK